MQRSRGTPLWRGTIGYSRAPHRAPGYYSGTHAVHRPRQVGARRWGASGNISQRSASRGSVYKGTHGGTHGVLTGVLIVYSHRTHGQRIGRSNGEVLVMDGSGSTGWCIAPRRARCCGGYLTVRYCRGLDGYSPRPPHPSEYRMQSRAHLCVLRVLFGIGLRHARRAVVRVRSADTRADQPRRHQPAHALADLLRTDLRADVIADVSRRCALRALDPAESSDGAGPAPWYRL